MKRIQFGLRMNDMKKYLIPILILLFALPCEARMSMAVVGGGVTAAAPSCSSCGSPSNQFDSNTTLTSSDLSSFDIAYQFVVATDKCITGVSWVLFDSGSTGTTIYEIWTDASDLPVEIVGAGYTCTVADRPNDYSSTTWTTCSFAATQTLPAGTYHAVARRGTYTNIGMGYAIDATKKNSSRTTGAWAHDIYPGNVRVIGCDPS
jgi:hypothetical protein